MFKLLSFVSLSMMFAIPLHAEAKLTGNPQNTVIVLETDTSRVNHKRRVNFVFCPVNNQKQFRASCGSESYSYPSFSKDFYDVLDVSFYEYDFQWRWPKPKALYAMSKTNVGESGKIFRKPTNPVTTTQVAPLAGGTVAVMTLPFTDWDSGYKDALKRVKAVFKQQYGAEITNKMKFVAFRANPIKCKFNKPSLAFQVDNNKCNLQ